MRHRTLRALGVALVAAGLAVPAAALTSTPAAATNCVDVRVSNPARVTTSGGGTAEFTGDGLIMRTPLTPSKVTYRHQLGAPVPFSDVRTLRYTTDRQDGATGVESTVAAYKLGVDTHGDGTVDGVLVYEPYYNGTVTTSEETHDALGGDARNGKWWYSAEPGNKQTTATWAEWQAGTGPVAFPAPEVRWFAVEQGTWNTGAITRVDDVKFATTGGYCKRITFRPPHGITKPPATTTPPTTRPTTVAPTTTAPATSEPTPSATAEPPPSDDEGAGAGSLPVTGTPIAYAAAGGGVLLAAGVVALVWSRRRRGTEFVA